jgi:hypothetical protein
LAVACFPRCSSCWSRRFSISGRRGCRPRASGWRGGGRGVVLWAISGMLSAMSQVLWLCRSSWNVNLGRIGWVVFRRLLSTAGRKTRRSKVPRHSGWPCGLVNTYVPVVWARWSRSRATWNGGRVLVRAEAGVFGGRSQRWCADSWSAPVSGSMGIVPLSRSTWSRWRPAVNRCGVGGSVGSSLRRGSRRRSFDGRR